MNCNWMDIWGVSAWKKLYAYHLSVRWYVPTRCHYPLINRSESISLCVRLKTKKLRFECTQCDKVFAKSLFHCSTPEKTVNTPETPSSFMTAVITESDDDQEWPEDHSGLINEPDYECGMNIRKRRLPCLDSNVRHPNTRQRNAYRIKWECRDNWTSRGALDSI